MNAHLARAHLWVHVKRPTSSSSNQDQAQTTSPHHHHHYPPTIISSNHNNQENQTTNGYNPSSDPIAWIVVYKIVRNPSATGDSGSDPVSLIHVSSGNIIPSFGHLFYDPTSIRMTS